MSTGVFYGSALHSVCILIAHTKSKALGLPDFYLFHFGHLNFVKKLWVCDDFCKGKSTTDSCLFLINSSWFSADFLCDNTVAFILC